MAGLYHRLRVLVIPSGDTSLKVFNTEVISIDSVIAKDLGFRGHAPPSLSLNQGSAIAQALIYSKSVQLSSAYAA
jgi:hypothetical protein